MLPRSDPGPGPRLNRRTVDELFGLDMLTRLKCPESGEEVMEQGKQFMLKCNIDQTTGTLTDGIALGLKEDR